MTTPHNYICNNCHTKFGKAKEQEIVDHTGHIDLIIDVCPLCGSNAISSNTPTDKYLKELQRIEHLNEVVEEMNRLNFKIIKVVEETIGESIIESENSEVKDVLHLMLMIAEKAYYQGLVIGARDKIDAAILGAMMCNNNDDRGRNYHLRKMLDILKESIKK